MFEVTEIHTEREVTEMAYRIDGTEVDLTTFILGHAERQSEQDEARRGIKNQIAGLRASLKKEYAPLRIDDVLADQGPWANIHSARFAVRTRKAARKQISDRIKMLRAQLGGR